MAATSKALRPFRLAVPQSTLSDLKKRLQATRWPDQLRGSANAKWEYGTELAYARELAAYWEADDGFDWAQAEAKFNGMGPQFTAASRDPERRIHFIHQRCTAPGRGGDEAPALLMSHGWPGSVYEFHKVIKPLSRSFHVICPSIPGYGFSDAPRDRGFHVPEVARDFHHLMTEVLGYETYYGQGGDWGSVIVQSMARLFPAHCRAIHINMPTPGIRGEKPFDGLDPKELAMLGEAKALADHGFGYQAIQRTKPQTLSYGLNDSPVGLLAWVVEKFRDWSDCNGDIESVHSKDDLLTNIMIYWVSQSIGSSMRLYFESMAVMPGTDAEMSKLGKTRIEVPVACALFPKELFPAPKKWCELSYNLKRYTTFEAGGHFAALEKPKELAEDVADFFLRDLGGSERSRSRL